MDKELAHVPARFRQPCELCPYQLDTREPGTFRYVSGWVMNREGGGGHGISLPKRENRWAHRWCVEKAVKGQTHQAALL